MRANKSQFNSIRLKPTFLQPRHRSTSPPAKSDLDGQRDVSHGQPRARRRHRSGRDEEVQRFPQQTVGSEERDLGRRFRRRDFE